MYLADKETTIFDTKNSLHYVTTRCHTTQHVPPNCFQFWTADLHVIILFNITRRFAVVYFIMLSTKGTTSQLLYFSKLSKLHARYIFYLVLTRIQPDKERQTSFFLSDHVENITKYNFWQSVTPATLLPRLITF